MHFSKTNFISLRGSALPIREVGPSTQMDSNSGPPSCFGSMVLNRVANHQLLKNIWLLYTRKIAGSLNKASRRCWMIILLSTLQNELCGLTGRFVTYVVWVFLSCKVRLST